MRVSHLKRSALLLATALAALSPAGSPRIDAQPWFYAPPPMPPATNPMAQRAALQNVQGQVNWFQNSLRNASGYQTYAYGNVWQQFQALRASYSSFTSSLTSDQVSRGGNDLAQLSAGLDIIQEAFGNYQQEVASGESSTSAFNEMCTVLYQASSVWAQELTKVSNRLRIGWR